MSRSETDSAGKNRIIIELLSVSGTIIGFLLIVLSRFLVEPFWRDLVFGMGLALAPSGVIGLIGDYMIFGRTMESLHGSNESLGAQVEALRVSTDFLKQSSALGLEMIYTDRATALMDFAPFMQSEARRKDVKGNLTIVGSSIKGLIENIKDTPSIIQDAIRSKCELRILLTHPQYSRYRENQEDRPTGAIEDEIFDGIRKLESCIEVTYPDPPDLKLSPMVKLYKGTPTCFMIVAGNRMLVNPYPYEEEAYRSFCIAVRKAEPRTPPADVERTIYAQYLRAHFEKPWERNAVPYRHYWLEGPNPKIAWDRHSCYGDVFVVQDAGHFYLAVYLLGQRKAEVRGMPTSIPCDTANEETKYLTLPDKFSVRLFDARENTWRCLDDGIGLLALHPERRRGKASGEVEGNLLNDYLMLGLFDPGKNEDKVESPHTHIDSAVEGLKGQPLPLFYVWFGRRTDTTAVADNSTNPATEQPNAK